MGFLTFINSLQLVPQCVFQCFQHESRNNSQATQSEHWDTQKKIFEISEDLKHLVFALVILATFSWMSEERLMVALKSDAVIESESGNSADLAFTQRSQAEKWYTGRWPTPGFFSGCPSVRSGSPANHSWIRAGSDWNPLEKYTGGPQHWREVDKENKETHPSQYNYNDGGCAPLGPPVLTCGNFCEAQLWDLWKRKHYKSKNEKYKNSGSSWNILWIWESGSLDCTKVASTILRVFLTT